MPTSLPGGRRPSQQSTQAAAAVAAAQAYQAAAPGTPVTIPAHVPAERVAILTGASPPPAAPSGTTIIKPQPGQPSQPPAPAPVYDDPDDGADNSTANPYLSLLGPGAGTLTDSSAGSTTTTGDDGRDIPWMLGAIVLVVGFLGWLLWRR